MIKMTRTPVKTAAVWRWMPFLILIFTIFVFPNRAKAAEEHPYDKNNICETGKGNIYTSQCFCKQHLGYSHCDKNHACWYEGWGTSNHCVGHHWDNTWDVRQQGNCTTPADVWVHCDICKKSYRLSMYSALGHDWGAWQDYNANYHVRYCRHDSNWTAWYSSTIHPAPYLYKACNESSSIVDWNQQVGSHSWSSWQANETQHWYYCTVCGHEEGRGNQNWTAWRNNGNGTHTRTCATCGYSQTDYHTWNGTWIDFDPEYYANTYPDLKAAFGYNAKKLYDHWINHGQYEGRTCSDGSRHFQYCTADDCGAYVVERHTPSWPTVTDSKSPNDHEKSVTFEEGCTKCSHRDYVELTIRVTGVNEKKSIRSDWGQRMERRSRTFRHPEARSLLPEREQPGSGRI